MDDAERLIRNARPEPVGEFLFREFARGEAFHRADGVYLIEGQSETVLAQEQASRHPGRALVAIGKRVVLREAEGIGRRQRAVRIRLQLTSLWSALLATLEKSRRHLV